MGEFGALDIYKNILLRLHMYENHLKVEVKFRINKFSINLLSYPKGIIIKSTKGLVPTVFVNAT